MSLVLTAVVFLPLAGAVLVAALPSGVWSRRAAIGVMALDAILTAVALAGFSPGKGMQHVADVSWVAAADIRYHLGVDGVGLAMLVLSVLLGLVAVVAAPRDPERPKLLYALLLLLQVGMNGVFVALDLVLFYVFWELVLVPMYFLIGMWGGERREYAAVKFFLYTLAGSVLMLVGIIALYLTCGTFDIVKLASPESRALVAAVPGLASWIFLAFFLGFAVKVPVWPLHTWLPDAHVEAPTVGSVLLAGILLKMGAYGFIRISLPILPGATRLWQPWVAALAVVSIVYGAAVAFAQADMKKLIAYSSVSHMGFAMLGIFSLTATGIDGAVAVMFSHGLVTGMLFLLVGMTYERTHTRQIAQVSGLVSVAPVIGGALAFASFASLGLPGLSGFVGEFLSLLGAWRGALPRWMTVVAAVGVLLAAAYMLRLVQRVVLGEPSPAVEGASDATATERAVLVPLVLLIVAVGLYWDLLLRYVDPVAKALASVLGAGG